MENQEILKELTKVIKTHKVKARMNISSLNVALTMLKRVYDAYKEDSMASVSKDILPALE